MHYSKRKGYLHMMVRMISGVWCLAWGWSGVHTMTGRRPICVHVPSVVNQSATPTWRHPDRPNARSAHARRPHTETPSKQGRHLQWGKQHTPTAGYTSQHRIAPAVVSATSGRTEVTLGGRIAAKNSPPGGAHIYAPHELSSNKIDICKRIKAST